MRRIAYWLLLGLAACSLLDIAFAQSGVTERDFSELNVSISVFDPGVPDDPLEERRLEVASGVREIESVLLPFMLRQVLVESNEWGAVRVMPESDDAAELSISGGIIRSDGDAVELSVRAVDASGRQWIDGVYASAVATNVEDEDARVDLYGFQALFSSISEDLLNARHGLDDRALSNVIDISFLRYASELAPTIFSGYLADNADGTIAIQRLPAENDPMAERIERVREVEYQFIDTVDERFQELHAEIESIYDLWLEYRAQVARFEASEVERVESRGSAGPRGSYTAIRSLYDNYRMARMQQQREEGRAQAFTNEVSPTVEHMQARVANLQFWLDDQYLEWREILSELFELETGFSNPEAGNL